jgi:hypothetical protein
MHLLLAALFLGADIDDVVRRTALAPNNGPDGRALPLMAHFNVGGADGLGFAPTWQLERLDAGLPLLPWFPMPGPGQGFKPADRAALRRCAERDLPVAFMGTQWERLLAVDPQFANRPRESNARAIGADGKAKVELSMFGPVEPWRECGAVWGGSAAFRDAQALYPKPPRVFLFSNNEHPKFRWDQLDQDPRFAAAHGEGKDADYKRKAVAEGLAERHRALHDGFRAAFSPAWGEAARFAAYNAFGPAFYARWPGWEKFSLHRPGAFSPFPEIWDGAAAPYYANNWEAIADDKLYSPQVQAMNWVFMLAEAQRRNPEFWFELALWDGRTENASDKLKAYRDRGQDYPPERYGGMARFGMWLLRPRALREFRAHREQRADTMAYFDAAAAAVAEVHANPALTEFWRRGTLVANNARPHPYQASQPAEWRDCPRWFQLSTDADPPEPWKLETEFPAFVLALTKGTAPQRQWLALAWSPPRDRPKLTVTIPGYRAVTLDATRGGAFHLVDEEKGTVTRVR